MKLSTSVMAAMQRWKRITAPAALLEGLVAGTWSVAGRLPRRRDGESIPYVRRRGDGMGPLHRSPELVLVPRLSRMNHHMKATHICVSSIDV
jgi:hypothetical protein